MLSVQPVKTNLPVPVEELFIWVAVPLVAVHVTLNPPDSSSVACPVPSTVPVQVAPELHVPMTSPAVAMLGIAMKARAASAPAASTINFLVIELTFLLGSRQEPAGFLAGTFGGVGGPTWVAGPCLPDISNRGASD